MKPLSLKKVRDHTLGIALAALLAVLTAEACGLVFYAFTHGGFFYFRSPIEAKGPDALSLGQSVIHPLFGYVLRPGAKFNYQGHPLTANNDGFQSRLDYPYVRAKDDFIVVILGGSVASGLGYSEEFTHAISARLKRAPELSNRSIVVLNMANAGYKEPQQIAVLGYYLAIGQAMDVVVNIDGGGEVISGSRNFERNVAIGMPAIDVLGDWYAQLENNRSKSAAAIAAKYHAARRNSEVEQSEKCWFAICYVWHRALASWEEKHVRSEETELLKAPTRESAFVLYRSNPRNKNEYEAIADLWERSSIILNDMARSAGAAYINILPPNKYYQTGRKFTAEEVALADDKNLYTRAPLENGYPLLVRRIAQLRKDKVAAIDGTHIFDTESRSVYVDTCCHFNELGNRLLGEFVADNILQQLATKASD